MSFGNVLTRLYDAFRSVLISIMTQLCDISSFVLMHKFIGKKENKHDKEYSLLKQDHFCLLFICLYFSLKPNSVIQSILLIVLSHWIKVLLFDEIPSNTPTEKKPWKEPPKKLNITNMKFRIWKTWYKLGWMNKQVNIFNRCSFWNFVSGHQFLTLLEIIL